MAPPKVAYGRPMPPATVAVMVSSRKLKPSVGLKVPIVSASTKPAKPATAPARAQVCITIRRAGIPLTWASARSWDTALTALPKRVRDARRPVHDDEHVLHDERRLPASR